MLVHINPSPIIKIPFFDLSEIYFVISIFLCQNVQTTVWGGGGVRAKSERPNFLLPYLGNKNSKKYNMCNLLVERNNIFQVKLEIDNENDKESRETWVFKMKFRLDFRNKYNCSDVLEDEQIQALFQSFINEVFIFNP